MSDSGYRASTNGVDRTDQKPTAARPWWASLSWKSQAPLWLAAAVAAATLVLGISIGSATRSIESSDEYRSLASDLQSVSDETSELELAVEDAEAAAKKAEAKNDKIIHLLSDKQDEVTAREKAVGRRG